MMRHTVIKNRYGFLAPSRIKFEEFIGDGESYVEVTAYDEKGGSIRIAINQEDWQDLKDGIHRNSFFTQQRGPGEKPEPWERWPDDEGDMEVWIYG